jgi:Domain of unknown function (DUF4232)
MRLHTRPTAIGALAAAACGLALTACGSAASPHAAPSAGTAVTPSASASTQPATAPATSSPAATAGSAPATQSPGQPGTVGACATNQLAITLTNTGAVAGQAGGYLRFANTSGVTCRMTGWPLVTALAAAGKATMLRHAQSTMFGAWHYVAPLPVLTLQPGGAAYAVVASGDEPAGSQPACPPPYTKLRVSPPGGSGSTVISAYLPGASSYLPSCLAVNGSPSAEVSAITALAGLAH